MCKVFQILQCNQAAAYGKQIFASGSGIEEGLLCKYASGSTVELCGDTETPVGYARGLRTGVYTPTSRLYADGEAMALTRGDGMLAASVDFFVEGSMPSPNAAIYAGANGLMTTTAGSNKQVGKCQRVEQRVEPIGGVGVNQDVAIIWFDIPASL